jgi:hypothetical protein
LIREHDVMREEGEQRGLAAASGSWSRPSVIKA